jgi:hypothetical protein
VSLISYSLEDLPPGEKADVIALQCAAREAGSWRDVSAEDMTDEFVGGQTGLGEEGHLRKASVADGDSLSGP